LMDGYSFSSGGAQVETAPNVAKLSWTQGGHQ
jgi:hypothetical protein